MARKIPAGNQCAKCSGLLGPLADVHYETMHPFCEWAKPQDWAALRPWLDGTLNGVQAGGM